MIPRTIILMIITALVFGGAAYIILTCEDGLTQCDNMTAMKEGAVHHHSAWSSFWDRWKFIGWR